jgi:hypothetical protein
VPYLDENLVGGHMRLILGIIVGVSLMVAMAGTEAKPMVNWDVVVKNFDAVTTLAPAGWKRIAG